MKGQEKESRSLFLDKLILPIVTAIVAGLILLYLEHNTSMFDGSVTSTDVPTVVIPVASPTQDVDLSIKELTFCEPQYFDETAEKCIASQLVFSKGISKIFISWVYSGYYSGEYSRLWYRNGISLSEFTRSNRMWGGDGQRDFTFVSYRNGFTAGDYLLEFRLNLDSRLIINANFAVQ